jgi:hypothetical protein
MIHGDVHFWIAPNPKEGGGAGQWLPPEKGHGRITYKNNEILVLKYFSCFILSNKSRGIVVIVKRRSKWQTCKTFI